jgi:hypothetical protein
VTADSSSAAAAKQNNCCLLHKYALTIPGSERTSVPNTVNVVSPRASGRQLNPNDLLVERGSPCTSYLA